MQVGGRKRHQLGGAVARDVEYVDRRSLALDVEIVLATLGKVLNREGIPAEGEATMTRFQGSPVAAAEDSESVEP